MRINFAVLALTGALAGMLVGWGPGAKAQSDAPGYITALACGEIPDHATVEIFAPDDTESSRALIRFLTGELNRLGYKVADKGTLRLSFDTATSRSRFGIGETSLGSLRADNQDGVEIRMNVWSSNNDSIVGGRRGNDDRSQEGDYSYRVTVTFNSTRDGKCQWRGEAIHTLGGREATELTKDMFAALLDEMGKSATRLPLQLD